ncbi:transposase [Streptomyces sp. NPDC060048]|uniref:transposase n=1 Tax=unclassified Streptomyces TaxID=2593676 RepID=UPI003681C203
MRRLPRSHRGGVRGGYRPPTRGRPPRPSSCGRAGAKRRLQTSPSPVDRGQAGSKHHLITDGHGTPLAVILTGGSRNDVTQLVPLLDAIAPVGAGPAAHAASPQSLLMIDTGVTPRPGLAQAVDGLHAARTDRIYWATITGSPRRFTVFLAEDLTPSLPAWADRRPHCVRRS